MTQPRFYIITNDAPRAMLRFSCHAGNLPGWIAVLDSFDDWMKIPSGATCMALWFGTSAELEGWRNAWSARKERGDLVGMTGDDLGKIEAWFEVNRAAPSMALLYGADEAESQVLAADLRAETEPVIPPAPMIEAPRESIKRSGKWT